MPRLSASHGAQKHRQHSRKGDKQPVCTLEIGKRGLTIKILELQRGQTDVTKSRQPWESPNRSTHAPLILARSWAAQLWWPLLDVATQPLPAHFTAPARAAQQRRVPVASTLQGTPVLANPNAAALEHTGQGREVHPSSATQYLILGAATGSLHT